MQHLWLKSYDKGVPYSLEPYPDQTLLDIVRDTAHQRPIAYPKPWLEKCFIANWLKKKSQSRINHENISEEIK